MTSRLSPMNIFRAHWRALSDYRHPKPVADVTTRLVVTLGPIGAGLVAWMADAELHAPDSLLAAVALLAGAFLAAFTHLSGERQRLTERAETWREAERIDRDALDETAAHVIVASYVAGVSAALLAVATNVGAQDDGSIGGAWAVGAVVLLAYLLIVFLIALPRLYSAYATSHSVRRELSGNHR